MKAWVIDTASTPYSLTLREVPPPAPQMDEVLIKVSHAALNRADLFQLQGQYPLPEETRMIPGLEASGTIEAVGQGVTALKPGDRVAALMTGGAYAEMCTVPAAQCMKLPDSVSLEIGASLPEALATVWLALFRTTHFREGETVLVHGGSSGIGTAAIQVITRHGGKAVVTAGSQEKCEFCTKLGATAINYTSEDFVTRVKEITGDKGVDVVIDIVGGDYIEKNLKCLSIGGRMVSLSFLDGAKASLGFGGLLMKNLTWSGVTLRSQPVEVKQEILASVEKWLIPALARAEYFPVIDRIFRGKDAQKAHLRMQEHLHIGKILLDMNAL